MISRYNSAFEPKEFLQTYTHPETGEQNIVLPVRAQIEWFWRVFPDGKISAPQPRQLQNGAWIATARIYANRHDAEKDFIAEGTAQRKYDPQAPSISPMEWASTAAIGVALRNAGFQTLNTQIGETTCVNCSYESYNEIDTDFPNPPAVLAPSSQKKTSTPSTPEECFKAACAVPCPIPKYSGKSLGDLISVDQSALVWVAKKAHDLSAREAAQLILDYAVGQAEQNA